MLRAFVRIFTLCGSLLGCGLAIAADSSWPDNLIIGTAGAGGTYDAYGQGLANLLRTRLGVAASTDETAGPQANIELLDQNKVQIAFTTLGAALQAAKASDLRKGSELDEMRAIAPMYESVFHFVVQRQSTVIHLNDLAGKTIGVGPAGGSTAYYVPLILKSLGISASFQNGEWADLGNALAARAIDALAVAGGTPFPALLKLSERTDLRFVDFESKEQLKVRLTIPELDATAVAAGVYPWLKSDYSTVGMFNFIVVRRDFPDSLVVAILETLFSAMDEMVQFSPAAAETLPANFVRNSFIPFHTGAIRWYQRHLPLQGGGD